MVLAKNDQIEQNWRKSGPIWEKTKLRLIWQNFNQNWDQKDILTKRLHTCLFILFKVF